MKRKIVTLLTIALSVTLLGGCGGNSETETANNSSSGFLSEITSTKSTVLSECLSEEKVIAYEVDSVDKAETPDNIYFFNDGKVTIIPGGEFGLTMGDFAQMKDKEIWEQYETVKETYCEKYIAKQAEDVQKRIDSINDEIKHLKGSVVCSAGGASEIILEYAPEKIDTLQIAQVVMIGGEVEDEVIESLYEEIRTMSQEVDVQNEEHWVFEEILMYCGEIDNKQAELDNLLSSAEVLDCKIPFSDLPFAFIVETDSSGNNVQSEALIYPTLNYAVLSEAPKQFYDPLFFAMGISHTQQIYDTTYNCIGTSGSGSFCTRETLTFDTLDSKNILIDLSYDEINELFKEEVMARYE